MTILVVEEQPRSARPPSAPPRARMMFVCAKAHTRLVAPFNHEIPKLACTLFLAQLVQLNQAKKQTAEDLAG